MPDALGDCEGDVAVPLLAVADAAGGVWFGGRANGAFSYVAPRALAQLKPGGRYRDWHGLIRAQLPSRQYPQSPQISGSSAQKAWPVPG